jgi:hypothetical protein
MTNKTMVFSTNSTKDKEMSRIQLTDTGMSACVKMSDGNPGALTVLAKLLKEADAIDPDNFLGGLGKILDLDTNKIYGSRIWMLYKDVAGGDLRTMLVILRSRQLGFISEHTLNHAIDNYGDGLDVPALVAQVEERLPKFQKAPAAVSK